MSCRRRVPLQEGQPCIQRDEPAGAPAASPAPGAAARGAGASTLARQFCQTTRKTARASTVICGTRLLLACIWSPNEVYSLYIPRIYHIYPEGLYMCGIYHIYTMDIKISYSCTYVQLNAIHQCHG